MIKLSLQFLAMVAIFLGAWFGLSKVDWVTLFHVKQAEKKTEEKLGDLYCDVISRMETEVTAYAVRNPIDSILIRLCERNDIDRQSIKLHILDKDDINAFALPDGHLVLLTGLITDCQSPEELSGVIAHELAHIELGHIMKKLVKEIGLSVLISLTTGNGNPEIIQQTVKVLSSTAFDRKLESEADAKGTEYLMNAGIDPEPFAAFLYRMSAGEKDLPDQMFWITTHPASEQRAKEILRLANVRKIHEEMLMDSTRWDSLQHIILERGW